MFKKLSGNKKSDNISAAQALKLQASYLDKRCNPDLPAIEPYMQIALQLTSPKAEIFEAALYYLQKIAFNNPQTATDITDLLKQLPSQHRLSQQNYALLLQTVRNIEENLPS